MLITTGACCTGVDVAVAETSAAVGTSGVTTTGAGAGVDVAAARILLLNSICGV